MATAPTINDNAYPPDNTIPPMIHVTSCGTVEAIGDYKYVDMYNERPRYKHVTENFWIRFSGIWYICDGPNADDAKRFLYYTNYKTKNCVNMEWQCEIDGKKPTPVVSQFSMGEVIETKVLGAVEDLWVYVSITKMHRDGTLDLFVLNHQKHRVHPEALIVDPKLCRKRRAKPKDPNERKVYDIFLCFAAKGIGFESDSDIARITFTHPAKGGELRSLIAEKFSKSENSVKMIKNGRMVTDTDTLDDKDKVIVVFSSHGGGGGAF